MSASCNAKQKRKLSLRAQKIRKQFHTLCTEFVKEGRKRGKAVQKSFVYAI